MKTKHDIHYSTLYAGARKVTIPKGTPVTEADNLPESGSYWVGAWDGMNDAERSWQRTYGFNVGEDEVE